MQYVQFRLGLHKTPFFYAQINWCPSPWVPGDGQELLQIWPGFVWFFIPVCVSAWFVPNLYQDLYSKLQHTRNYPSHWCGAFYTCWQGIVLKLTRTLQSKVLTDVTGTFIQWSAWRICIGHGWQQNIVMTDVHHTRPWRAPYNIVMTVIKNQNPKRDPPLSSHLVAIRSDHQILC